MVVVVVGIKWYRKEDVLLDSPYTHIAHAGATTTTVMGVVTRITMGRLRLHILPLPVDDSC